MPRSGVSKPHLSGSRYFPKTSIIFRGGCLVFVALPAQLGRQDSPLQSQTSCLLLPWPPPLTSCHLMWQINYVDNAKQTRYRSFVFNAFPIVKFRILSNLSYFLRVKKNKSSLNFQRTLFFLGRQDSNLWNDGTKSRWLTACRRPKDVINYIIF